MTVISSFIQSYCPCSKSQRQDQRPVSYRILLSKEPPTLPEPIQRQPPQELPGQQKDVPAALTQAGQGDAEHVEPVEQILPEPSLLDRLSQIHDSADVFSAAVAKLYPVVSLQISSKELKPAAKPLKRAKATKSRYSVNHGCPLRLQPRKKTYR